MLLLTLRFLLNRSDDELTRFGGGANARMGYLFAPSEGGHVPLEDELADDYAEFLAGTELAQVLYWEVRNIAGGRVDLLFSFGTHRFVAETKRELDDASPENLRSYLGQASLYQGSNVTLGLLLALDLTDKSRGVPHFRTNAWVEVVPPVVPGDLGRYVVVVRVPGNRLKPSTMSRIGASGGGRPSARQPVGPGTRRRGRARGGSAPTGA